MSTTAVMSELLGWQGDATGQPLCPGCTHGRLHPYAVTFSFPNAPQGLHHTSERVDFLEGWVAVCVGSESYERDKAKRYAGVDEEFEPGPIAPPCGFTMALTPKRHGGTQP